VSCFKAGYGAAAFARFAGKSCEARLREAGWWAREDSNLQPSGYEPLALTIELRARRAMIQGGKTRQRHYIESVPAA
jgi:hypothetical protein